MPLDEETILKIKQQEQDRKEIPTLDELLERLNLLKESRDLDQLIATYSPVAAGTSLFHPLSHGIQQLAAQIMIILLHHIKNNP